MPRMGTEPSDPLLLDFVEWIAAAPRSYADVLDAWKTSCPRLTVWEDAAERGLVLRASEPGRGVFVHVTKIGRTYLRRHGRSLR